MVEAGFAPSGLRDVIGLSKIGEYLPVFRNYWCVFLGVYVKITNNKVFFVRVIEVDY